MEKYLTIYNTQTFSTKCYFQVHYEMHGPMSSVILKICAGAAC